MATPPLVPSTSTNTHPHKTPGLEEMRARNDHPLKVSHTRAGGTWVAICVGAVVLVALVVFMLQNTQDVVVSFLGWQGSVPLALALLIAGLGVALIALVVGTIRIGQLRHRVTRAAQRS
jgi:uncharacterized integral membrane protein